uniref:Uncharacterized protein n=1 Tax=Aegilops tauschii subsp. strangulata TaxID=200361 RepID=A0A453DGN4_AEGTS
TRPRVPTPTSVSGGKRRPPAPTTIPAAMATTAAAAAAVSNLSLRLPSTLPFTVSFPTRLSRIPHAPLRRLRTASSRTLAAPATSEVPEAEELRLEAESALEWGGVCARL